MIRTTEVNKSRWPELALVAGCLSLTACNKPATEPVATPAPAVNATNAVKLVEESRLAAVTTQFTQAQQAQSESIQKLLARLEQLEKQDTERATTIQTANRQHAAEIKTHEDRAQALTGRIAELEAKVNSLQAGRVLPEIALAADDAPTTRELEQKIRVVERKNELAVEAAEAKAKELPRLAVGPGGFSFSSADTNFVLKLKALVQLDSRSFIGDNPLLQGNDGFTLRRARPILEGTLYRDFDFQLVSDFGGSAVQVFDAWLNYRYQPGLQVRAGKFKGPVGFENLQSDATLPFNERSLVSDFTPSRSIGVQLWGDLAGETLTYAAGVFNGAGDSRNPNTSDFGDDKEFAGKLAWRPFKNTSLTGLTGLEFGAGGSYSLISSNALALPGTGGGTLPGYTTAGAQQFFAYNPVVGPVVADGAHWRLSPYVAYTHGPFGLLGEYGISHQGVYNSSTFRSAELDHTAWQIAGQWVLTGEPASFNGIIPNRPFSPRNGGWGAWQVVGRFGQLSLDSDTFPNFSNPNTSANGATSWSVGVNWWLNRNLRLLTSYSHTTFDGGGANFSPVDPTTQLPPATVTHQDEQVFSTRLQFSF